MKKMILLAVAVLSLMSLSAQTKDDWAQLGRYTYENARIEKAPDAVFMGNSVIDCWADTVPQFFVENNYAGRGISGQVSSQMLVRFRQDVIGLKPKAVVILCGINDIAENDGYMPNEGIMNNIKSMCELAEVHNITPVLCSILPCDHFHWLKNQNIYPAGRVLQMNELISAYAREKGYEYVDFHTPMTNRKGGMRAEYTYDSGHPNSTGYAVMMPLVKLAIEKSLKK
ncbi:MAG: acylhydrolase [Muribaculaceae bacterium]|nr:acylhydrolase [Muribaculaceae bacterium]